MMLTPKIEVSKPLTRGLDRDVALVVDDRDRRSDVREQSLGLAENSGASREVGRGVGLGQQRVEVGVVERRAHVLRRRHPVAHVGGGIVEVGTPAGDA